MNKLALRNHFKALLNRSDITDALADTFIDQSITRITRSLRVPAMEGQASYLIAAATPKVSIPSDFLEAIDIYYDNHMLTRISMREMQDHIKSGQSGKPQFFARERQSFLLSPIPATGTIFINYYAQFSAMPLDSDENILAKIASDLIIYGALAYAADYYLDERSELFTMKYAQFFTEIQDQANEAETVGTLQAIRPTTYYDLE